MELGQSHHHEFWTIGLNVARTRLPVAKVAAEMANVLSARRYEIVSVAPAPRKAKFTTIGQWYWNGGSGSGWGIS